MTKILIWIVVSLIVLVCVYFSYLSYSAKPVFTGINEGKLGPCSSKPNCVNSEYPGDKKIDSIDVSNLSGETLWTSIESAIQTGGGKVIEQTGDYLRAEYQSTLFRFVDDLELRHDAENSILHVRSGSRSGESDLGVNRKRVEALRELLQ